MQRCKSPPWLQPLLWFVPCLTVNSTSLLLQRTSNPEHEDAAFKGCLPNNEEPTACAVGPEEKSGQGVTNERVSPRWTRAR